MIKIDNEKTIAYLALISGLTISAVAVYYSVAGLVSIFAASALSIIVMGVALEVSKLVATVWLKINWDRAPKSIKAYLISAIVILMVITSMGIFGFLSKAHLDQNLVSGDVVDKVAILDEKIKTQRDNIDAARKALRQMDEAVDQTMARSSDEKGADKAAALRRSQQRERTQLQNDISKAQAEIAKLNEEKAPIAKELRVVEAEVGPIKYIAKLIYGDNPDANILEKAVTWVIIIIVIVFDPLAVILLLASQYSFQWLREKKESQPEEEQEMASDIYEFENLNDTKDIDLPDAEHSKGAWPFPTTVGKKLDDKKDDFKFLAEDADLYPEGKDWENKENSEDKKPLDEWNAMIAEAEKAVAEEREEQDILDSVPHTEKEAMQIWKSKHPDSSLKQQRRLYEKGAIDKLPWEEYLKAKPDETEDSLAAQEALKWAQEQFESAESKKKDNDLDRTSGKSTDKKEQRGIEGYIQNAEQNESTIWQRVHKKGD